MASTGITKLIRACGPDLPVSRVMGCCDCFGFTSKPKRVLRPTSGFNNCHSRDLLLIDDVEDEVDCSYSGDATNTTYEDESETPSRAKSSEEILQFRLQNDLICRQHPIKETDKVVRTEDEYGNKMVNQYVREYKIGSGSYGKVVLYRCLDDGKHYAIKAFHKSHLSKRRVAPSETAMTDVLREVLIMKMLEHPNIVNLVEVINDPESDHFYMVLEYVEGKWICGGSVPPSGLGEAAAQKYLRDIVSGLTYLHNHYIVHGDIKPDNLLITRDGTVKIGDFSVSQIFEDENDELRRSPGTPVFTAPECCLGHAYHGKAADTWAVGVTLYCMVSGQYPFLGDTLQDTYDKILNNPLILPVDIQPPLRNLLEGILCKDPTQRMTLSDISEHSWVIGSFGPIPRYLCWCKRKSSSAKESSFQSKEETGSEIVSSISTNQIDLSPLHLVSVYRV